MRLLATIVFVAVVPSSTALAPLAAALRAAAVLAGCAAPRDGALVIERADVARVAMRVFNEQAEIEVTCETGE